MKKFLFVTLLVIDFFAVNYVFSGKMDTDRGIAVILACILAALVLEFSTKNDG